MRSEWVRQRLGDVIDVNPRRALQPKSESVYLSMSDLREFHPRVRDAGRRSYTSGTKFANGDTLLARITPCLENGKAAFVDFLNDGEVAHGSTEFIVLAPKAGVTDPCFVYYLSIAPSLRQFAVSRMTGTSGRQRLAAGDLADFELALPPLHEQEAIAGTLSARDRRVAQLDQQGEALAALNGALFAEMSRRTDLEWVQIGDFATAHKGISYKGKFLDTSSLAEPLINLGVFGRTALPRWEKLKRYGGPTKPHHRVAEGSVVVCATDMTQDRTILGKALRVPERLDGALFTHHLLALTLSLDAIVPPVVVALALNHEPTRRRVSGYANGTTVLALPTDAVLSVSVPVLHPEEHQDLLAAVSAIETGVEHSWTEREATRLLRDALLPSLMSGAA